MFVYTKFCVFLQPKVIQKKQQLKFYTMKTNEMNTKNENNKKYGYIIDYVDGSGSGCDTIFATREDAERHMSFWTEKERQGCEIVEVEL